MRRAHALVGAWSGEEFTIENYLTRTCVSVSPIVAHALNTFGDFTTRTEAASRLGRDGLRIVRALLEANILVRRGTRIEELDQRIESEWSWQHDARYFHFATRATTFQDDFAAEHDQLAELAKRIPPPAPLLQRGGGRVPLERTKPDDTFWSTLAARRTQRAFSREPIPRQDLATLLEWTWGATAIRNDPQVGPYLLKTSPSGGARHPTEVYVLVHRVENIRAGLYHYHVGDHSLETMRTANLEKVSIALGANQPWLGDAAAVFVMTAVIGRSMWKYAHSHAYRVVLLDMGHLGQTFHLACTALGLAPFTSAALDEPRAERVLGLHPAHEIALYLAATGKPVSASAP